MTILNNEMYVGRLVWNRLTYMKDPETGRRRSRARANRELVITDVSDLRIVPQELWNAVKARQTRLDAAAVAPPPERSNGQAPSPQFWKQQRPISAVPAPV